MKIEYEEDDIVRIEDNIEAGDLAAEHVRLIKKHEASNVWLVEDVEYGKRDWVAEKYFIP